MHSLFMIAGKRPASRACGSGGLRRHWHAMFLGCCVSSVTVSSRTSRLVCMSTNSSDCHSAVLSESGACGTGGVHGLRTRAVTPHPPTAYAQLHCLAHWHRPVSRVRRASSLPFPPLPCPCTLLPPHRRPTQPVSASCALPVPVPHTPIAVVVLLCAATCRRLALPLPVPAALLGAATMPLDLPPACVLRAHCVTSRRPLHKRPAPFPLPCPPAAGPTPTPSCSC